MRSPIELLAIILAEKEDEILRLHAQLAAAHEELAKRDPETKEGK